MLYFTLFWNRYCEIISQSVKKNPQSYLPDFVSQVYELALRLKYHDLHYQMGKGEVHDMPDPDWLLSLQKNLHELQYNYSHNQQVTQNVPNESYTGSQTPDVSLITHAVPGESYYEQNYQNSQDMYRETEPESIPQIGMDPNLSNQVQYSSNVQSTTDGTSSSSTNDNSSLPSVPMVQVNLFYLFMVNKDLSWIFI